jgi:hypothetical protein
MNKHYEEDGRYTEKEAIALFGNNISKLTKITCYRENEYWSSKKNAMAFYKRGCKECDPSSSEWSRYATIYTQLKGGASSASDHDGDDYGGDFAIECY